MRRHVIILGSGRSGTSMLASMFAQAGYFFGDRLHPPAESNPFGYYESRDVNSINTRLLRQRLPRDAAGLEDVAEELRRTLGPDLHAVHAREQASWLWLPASPDPQTKIEAGPLLQPVLNHFARGPVCLKDPRFSHTYQDWLAHLPDATRFVVTFRDPSRTVDSIVRDARRTYAPPLPVSESWALAQWIVLYQRLLRRVPADDPRWLFVHDDDVVSAEAVPALEAHTGASLDLSAIKAGVRRSQAGASDPAAPVLEVIARTVLSELMHRAAAGAAPEEATLTDRAQSENAARAPAG